MDRTSTTFLHDAAAARLQRAVLLAAIIIIAGWATHALLRSVSPLDTAGFMLAACQLLEWLRAMLIRVPVYGVAADQRRNASLINAGATLMWLALALQAL